MARVRVVLLTCAILFIGAVQVLFIGAVQSSYESPKLEAYPSVEQEMSSFKNPTLLQPNQLRDQRRKQRIVDLTHAMKQQRQNQRQKKRIVDLTHEMRNDLPSFGDDNPVGDVVRLVVSMDDGSEFNLSEMQMSVHTGTHLDAPGHFVNEHYKAGFDVSKLALESLVGPVLIVDTPRDSNITAEVLEKLDIPKGVERLLFRTSNTDKRLMWNPKFDSSFTGLTLEGAEWLLLRAPEVKLIGTDYLSVVAFDHGAEGHRVLLEQGLILVEGLNLDDVEVGLSNLYCLPLRLVMAEGCPVRCILVD